MCNGMDASGANPNESDYTSAPDGTNPALCWPYAYRTIYESNGTTIKSYVCNTPYPGRISINEKITPS